MFSDVEANLIRIYPLIITRKGSAKQNATYHTCNIESQKSTGEAERLSNFNVLLRKPGRRTNNSYSWCWMTSE